VSTRGRTVAVLVVLALVVAGCSNRPSAQVRSDDARRSYRFTTTLADELVAHARETFPELTFDLHYEQRRDDDWSACSDAPYPNGGAPRAFSWTPHRTLSVSPVDPPSAVPLIEPIAQAYLDDGWMVARDTLDSRVTPALQISKDGVSVRFKATVTDDDPEKTAHFLDIFVIGPCQFSPDDFADFDAADPDAYFGDD
jgi:hypothetical protein